MRRLVLPEDHLAADALRSVADPVFLADVLDGLSRPRKVLPSKYFYDARGSALFDAICTLPEYYPTRTETALLALHADAIAAWIGARTTLIELGSGSSVKVRLLLDALVAPALTCRSTFRASTCSEPRAAGGGLPAPCGEADLRRLRRGHPGPGGPRPGARAGLLSRIDHRQLRP